MLVLVTTYSTGMYGVW